MEGPQRQSGQTTYVFAYGSIEEALVVINAGGLRAYTVGDHEAVFDAVWTVFVRRGVRITLVKFRGEPCAYVCRDEFPAWEQIRDALLVAYREVRRRAHARA